jgi:catalase
MPDAPDFAPSAAVRGLAFTFTLPDGTATDLMCISMPVFVTKTPEDQLGLFRAAGATKPGMPAPTPIQQFVAAHPETQRFLAIPKPMPKSFATQPFYALHAYKLTNAKGESHVVRFQVVPDAGAAFLTPEEVQGLPPNALFEELESRLLTAPVTYKLLAQVGAAGDPTADPTIAWPEGRPLVELGTITVTRPVPDSREAEKKIGFMPNRALPGLAMSDDPFLAVRADVYAIAYPARQ